MNDSVFDLRSDTVTRPDGAMRAAMARAEADDDAYGDCPVVGALEARIAALLSKPAALWVPTGTMANQLAVAIHTRRGDVVACAPGAHVRIHEDASPAALWGVQLMTLGDRRGFAPEALEALLAEETCGWPPVRLVWLENTLGESGGRIWPLEELEAVSALARERGRAVHLDGARLWNAHVATGIPMATWSTVTDTVSVALSKGLGAPAGSVLCGPTELIAHARRLKHALGGAMRQGAGLMAAAGLYALEHNLDDLADDHRRAKHLAAGIAELPHWSVDPPQTNLILARIHDSLPSAAALCKTLRQVGIRCNPNVAREVRLAVHRNLDDQAIEEVIKRVRRALEPVPLPATAAR